jgi:hypothetical protein
LSASSATPILKKLLLRNSSRSRLIGAWMALCIGCTLLLLSVLIWWNFRELLQGRSDSDSLGSTFLTISKSVNQETTAVKGGTQISDAEIVQLRTAPQVQDVGLLTPANFKISASLGSGALSFYTLLFLEAAPDRFMDRMPASWSWKEGDNTIPIILSRDFLNMYNYIFAPSQGLPQLSENTVKALGFTLTMGEGPNQREYRAQVEGFSDRISSVLVPQSFIDYGNRTFASGKTARASRLIVKVADPSSNEFVQYLAAHHYTTNAEQLRFNKMRSVVEAVSGGTGVLAVLLMGIGALVFVLFIELTMARAQESILLLRQLGYSPRRLSTFLTLRYLPVMLSALLAAALIAVAAQYFASVKGASLQLSLHSFPGAPMWIAVALSGLALLWQMRRSIRKALR